ncbi:MAG TPA: phosphate-starvation-inducible PsiE family protein [Chloroflexia bacterium]|nr:phosphate-starvation-inducible PsiE family protein [Chloroflexia bacterium]
MDSTEEHAAGPRAESDPFKAEPLIRFRALSYQAFELVDDFLHLGVAALLVIIAGIVFVHIVLTGLNGLDLWSTSPENFFNIILNGINTILFVVIVLELLATVVAHLRNRTFALRPLLIIGVISSVRHILIVTAHMSAASETVKVEVLTEQIVELVVNTFVTVMLVLCYGWVTRADQVDKSPTTTSG